MVPFKADIFICICRKMVTKKWTNASYNDYSPEKILEFSISSIPTTHKCILLTCTTDVVLGKIKAPVQGGRSPRKLS